MRRYIFVLTAILLLTAFLASAQGVLPRSFAGWIASSLPTPIVAIPQVSWVSQLVLNEYGWVSTQPGDYTHGSDNLQIALYEMKDPSGAYGLYSYLRTPDMPRANLTDHSSMSHDHALVLMGNLVLDIRGHDLQRSITDLKALVTAVSPHAKQGPLPTLWEHLPIKGIVERTDHYILGPVVLNQLFSVSSGDWLGFSDGAEAELAKYRLNGSDVTLLIADFPTPQAAANKLAELQRKFDVNRSNLPANQPTLFAKRSLTLLAIVSGARSQSAADTLLGEVRSGTEITWNEPPFALTQPNIATIIVGTIIGTAIICAFALISGLAFGGFRLIIKRMLPDKVFDRSSQLQILQLGLSSKPINAEDFYSLGTPRHK